MTTTETAQTALERTYLEMRAKILELAAAFDRIDRADSPEAVQDDLRLENLRRAVDILSSAGFDRAERVQMTFSDKYQPGWNQ